MSALVWKILTADQWAAFEAEGRFAGAPVDLADGYIHLSAPDQVEGTLAKHFANQTGLILAGFDAEALGASLCWEPSRGGALFPHLYRALERDEVVEWRAAP